MKSSPSAMRSARPLILIALLSLSTLPALAAESRPAWMAASQAALEPELAAKYGAAQAPRLRRGMSQVASFWRDTDGDRKVFEEFVRQSFAGDQKTLDTTFQRFEDLLESLDGHMNEIILAFKEQTDLDRGEILPFDEVFSGYDPSAHVGDDFFDNKLAFVVLLNFPLTTLEQRLTEGPGWSRREWAEARLAQRFGKRIPAEVNLAVSRAAAESAQYIAGYNIWMHHLLDDRGGRLFPPKLRLLSHWNLRDEIKARYSDREGALPRQRMIQKVMERIVTQTIPEVVVDNPHVDWNPMTNEVRPAAAQDSDAPPPAGMKVTNAPEPDTRYAMLLGDFQASRRVDPYSPPAPTLIARRFEEDREIPEPRVRQMLESLLASPHFAKTARLIAKRLGRKLEPFDIWYNGFRARGAHTEAELDAIVSKRYPTPDAYRRDMPNLLVKLGFPPEDARYVTDHIVVDPARGSGHAWASQMRAANSHLRTRVGAQGMDYKGFNIAVHEMGHNVEQVLSLNRIDHTLLRGVPNTAFTEALAFVFQDRDLELLGLPAPDAKAEAMKVLDEYWGSCEISAVALVDMGVWHWMYEHPEASPAALKEATVRIAREVWNRYYAPVFGRRDVVLFGIYSHMIDSFLYLPDYPIGHLIAFQIKEQVKKSGSIGPEFMRMVKMGRVAPDLWMKNATDKPVGPESLLAATGKALSQIR
ncbi:MAG TPA: hypothetical protein VGR67_13485 [Candidatus Polarisedimenticolia bacterium]|nr:hypothetical protein [Candidatus Polarisedimenticolia bacterium]